MIDKWVWRREKSKVKQAKIKRDNRNLQDVMGTLAIRDIHASVRIDKDFFIFTFHSHGQGAKEKQRKIIEEINISERKNNEKETGISETNKEKESRKWNIKRAEIRAEEERERIENIKKMKLDFEDNPDKRFNNIRNMGIEKKFQTTYVIELKNTVIFSKFNRAYPNADFPETKSHNANSRYFYVGTTWHTAEERFHTARINHMSKKGSVRKHRLIQDNVPYEKSINHLDQLSEQYGYLHPNPPEATRYMVEHYMFEHYVAWALYKKGHFVWGPTIQELQNNGVQDLKWLGEDPYI